MAKKYIGFKTIEAEPMNLGDYNKFRGWTIPENENPATEGYKVVMFLGLLNKYSRKHICR